MKTKTFVSGSGIFTVEAQATCAGDDLVLVIGGGDSPHVGAAALAVPRPSLADPTLPSSSASVLCVTGHKEDMLSRSISLELSKRYGNRVVVVSGIHIDHATGDDISRLEKNIEAVVTQVKSWLDC